MIARKLEEFLRRSNTYYGQVPHRRTVSAVDTALGAEQPVEEMAKVVMVKIDGKHVMTVVASNATVDLERLKKITGAESVTLAMEEEFSPIFDDCETGAMPPFGNLYNLPEYVDVLLGNQDLICFNAGTHTEVCQLPYKIFERLTQPVVARISR